MTITTDPQVLRALRKKNNPENKETGHYSGRCSRCGSNDLWDDYMAYGCNCCGAILNAGDAPNDPKTGLPGPRIVRTR